MSIKYFTIIITISLILLIVLIPRSTAISIDIEEPYTISLDIARYGIIPRFVSILDEDGFMVAGSINNTNAVSILRIIDPYKGLEVEQIYPLVGEPTAIATNGFPVNRIAIGSSKGEILLFSLERGRIVGALYTIIGADFYVNKIAITKTALGEYRIATLVSEGGPRTYPCTTCYIYIFNEDGKGLLRIGPKPGNATAVYSGINIQDMAPLKVYTPTEIYSDASKLLIAYTSLTKTIVLNITLYINNTYIPGANTLVEVIVYNKTAIPQSIVRYGVNADSSGIARIPLPLLYGDKTYANISIRDITGGTIYFYALTPSDIAISDEILLPNIILTRVPDTRDARRVYGTPQFLKMTLELLDISNAPLSYRSIAISPFRLDLDAIGLSFVTSAGASDYVFSYTYLSKRIAIVSTISVSGNKLVVLSNSSDYIGSNVQTIDSIAYDGNKFIHIALSDGRVRTYQRIANTYRLISIYNIGGPIKRFLAFPEASGYTYLAISPAGLQIVSIDPYILPFLRNYLSIAASINNLIDGDGLADLSTSLLANSTNVLIIRHIDKLLSRGTPTTLGEIIAPTLTLRIFLPGNESMDKVYINFSYPYGYIVMKPTLNGTVTIPNILPNIKYSLYIWYQEPYIQPETITLTINKSSSININITMKYKEYNVTLLLRDPYSNELIAPYKIIVDGKTIIESSKSPLAILRLIYGSHNIEIHPADGYEMVYRNISLQTFIDRDQTIDIDMIRKTYNVNINILDSLTNRTVIAPINISIGNIRSIVTQNMSISIVLPYGNHTMSIHPARGYENVYKPIDMILSISRDTTINILLERKIYSIRLNLSDPYTGYLVVPVDIYLNATLVKQGVKGETVLMIPYGDWILRIAPSKGFEGSYNVLEQAIKVLGDGMLTYNLDRVEYPVSISIRDDVGRVIAPIELYAVGIVNRTTTIDISPTMGTLLYLPYGNYTVIAKPAKGYENVYLVSSIDLEVKSPRNIAITMNRIRYNLNITIRDISIGILRAMFEIYANNTKVVDKVSGPITISLPYGVYTIQAVPMPAFVQQYESSKPVVVQLFNSTSIEIPIARKMYSLKITVLEGETPIKNAEVTIISEESGAIFTKLITDEYGVIVTKVSFGSYRIEIAHPSYETRYMMLNVDSDRQEIVYLRPTLITYIYRFLPIVGVLIGIGIAIYIGLKIRAIIARRLAVEEEVF